MGSGNILGKMVGLMKATGRRIKCQVKEHFYGLTVVNSWENTAMTKRMVMGFTVDLMGRSTLGNGRMENSMDQAK